jgi:hypothetical protein
MHKHRPFYETYRSGSGLKESLEIDAGMGGYAPGVGGAWFRVVCVSTTKPNRYKAFTVTR